MWLVAALLDTDIGELVYVLYQHFLMHTFSILIGIF